MSAPFGTMRKPSVKRSAALAAVAFDTATRTSSFRHTSRSTGEVRATSFERSAYAWNVATTGAVERSAANIPVDGANGSCTWITSGRSSSSDHRTRRIDPRLGQIGATDPLYGTFRGRPTTRTQG